MAHLDDTKAGKCGVPLSLFLVQPHTRIPGCRRILAITSARDPTEPCIPPACHPIQMLVCSLFTMFLSSSASSSSISFSPFRFYVSLQASNVSLEIGLLDIAGVGVGHLLELTTGAPRRDRTAPSARIRTSGPWTINNARDEFYPSFPDRRKTHRGCRWQEIQAGFDQLVWRQ